MMEEELKRFVYHKNQWDLPIKKKDPNIRGEKIGKLLLDGKVLVEGSFPILQKKKKDYCKMYGISKERAKDRFKITY